MLFKDVKIGQKFHTGKSNGMSTNKDTVYWEEYTKYSKSTAICTAQIGYGNLRGVGSRIKFFGYSTVYPI